MLNFVSAEKATCGSFYKASQDFKWSEALGFKDTQTTANSHNLKMSLTHREALTG